MTKGRVDLSPAVAYTTENASVYNTASSSLNLRVSKPSLLGHILDVAYAFSGRLATSEAAVPQSRLHLYVQSRQFLQGGRGFRLCANRHKSTLTQ